jgi:hypothetical protein
LTAINSLKESLPVRMAPHVAWVTPAR